MINFAEIEVGKVRSSFKKNDYLEIAALPEQTLETREHITTKKLYAA